MKIDSTSFGSITIEGKKYEHDVWIDTNGNITERNRNHEFTLEEFNLITKDNPEVLVIGIGQNGVVKVDKGVYDEAKKRSIEVKADKTPKAIEIYNKYSEEKKTAAAIHVTC